MAETTREWFWWTRLRTTKTRRRSSPSDPVFRIWFADDTCSELTTSSDPAAALTKLAEPVSYYSLYIETEDTFQNIKYVDKFQLDPIMIYPNIVNMLGEMTVDVNAICLDRTQTYILMIEQRQVTFRSLCLFFRIPA